ncbi:MAG: AbrB/MazE/SpoVT family DNA-binding domain-containing protein [Propionibacteriaceae bacterium]|nr:AbrB/MazE/SpoVT family DNA-binding domain-containing protein [Propionibacteriaceae bacterium]
MIETIGDAGRMVIPKALRDTLGLRPGKVNVEADATGFRVEVPVSGQLVEHDGRLYLPDDAEVPSGDELRAFRC